MTCMLQHLSSLRYDSHEKSLQCSLRKAAMQVELHLRGIKDVKLNNYNCLLL